MPWVGFEPTIPAFQRAKTIHALDRAASVIGAKLIIFINPLFAKYSTTSQVIRSEKGVFEKSKIDFLLNTSC
jgi:hypothetical protein